MRSLLIVGLALLLPAASAETPIPQDTARMEKRFRERLEWNRRTLEGAYDRVGKKDPRWDKAAHQALDLAARMFAQQFDPILQPSDVHTPAKKAVDAGCDDPLINYLYARTSVGVNFPGKEEQTRRLQAAEVAMSASAYPPCRRAVAIEMATQQKAWKPNITAEERREVEQKLEAILDLLPRSVADDSRNVDWEELWYGGINSVIAMHKQLLGDYKAAFDRVNARLAKVSGIEALRLTVKGHFQIQWGWEARTTEFAPNVTEEQFRIFHERLQEARTALNEAWRLKPDEPHVAQLMLTVEKGIGEGDRKAMETWFERAMKADGNDQQACWSKLDWLDPKWYGGDTPDEMMAFGKACGATKNWHTGITLLAADAHLRYWSKLPRDGSRAKYMRSPEVWADIQPVYEEYLKHFPDDDVHRSKYAMLCYLSGHFPEAHVQFQAVGDRLTQWPTGPWIPLEAMKRAREQTKRAIAGKPLQKKAPARKSAPKPIA